MLLGVELKVIRVKNNMTKKKQAVEPVAELCDLLKKSLALSLFNMNVPQVEIARKIRTDLNAVNEFLKGIKKK